MILGFSIGVLPSLAFAAWACLQNPWFLDRPGLYFALTALPPGLLGAALLRGRVPERTGLFGLVPLHLLALLLFWPTPAPDFPRLLVVGVDGATWDIIDRMELPAFQSLRQQGGHGVLRSMDPMFSPLLWTTMASGKPPEESGIHGFNVRSSDCEVPRLWDLAEDAGMKVGIYKWLVTWPPREVPGFMVPDWLAPSPETFPADLGFVKELELANRLKRKKVESRRSTLELVLAGIPKGLRFSTIWAAAQWKAEELLQHPQDDRRYHAAQLLRGRIDRDVFVHQLHAHQPGLATFTYYGTDALGHRFWGGPEVDDAYRQADSILGELLARVGPDTAVVVVSDHGFKATDAAQAARRAMPLTERLQARLGERLGAPVQVSRLGTKLVVSAAPGLAEAIAELVDENGLPFYRIEAIPGSESLGLDLVDPDFSAERLAAGTVGGEPLKDYVTPREPQPGDHDPRGVLLVRAACAPKGPLPEAQLLDLAPTLQAMLGIAPAQDLSGNVLFCGVGEGPASRDALAAKYRAPLPAGEERSDTEALKALGYVE